MQMCGWLYWLFILCLYVSKIYLHSCVCVCVQIHKYIVYIHTGLPGGSYGKVSACNGGDPVSIPGLERSPGGGNGTPLQYSCLENPMDREAWWATVHGVAKNWTRLSDVTFYTYVYFLQNIGMFALSSMELGWDSELCIMRKEEDTVWPRRK